MVQIYTRQIATIYNIDSKYRLLPGSNFVSITIKYYTKEECMEGHDNTNLRIFTLREEHLFNILVSHNVIIVANGDYKYP